MWGVYDNLEIMLDIKDAVGKKSERLSTFIEFIDDCRRQILLKTRGERRGRVGQVRDMQECR